MLLLTVVMFVISCKKDDPCVPPASKAPESETNALRTMLDNQNITFTEDSRGFFFHVTQSVDGEKPDLCSTVSVNYVLKLMNGNVIEANNDISFRLTGLITGWQMGIPLIGKGSTIILYLPPSLAYGNQASGSIPANSNLIFEIELLDVF